ncbi:HAD-IC family P-type ATPase [Solirubrobacter soli]|uniref:HAD-IC family P-type ATPase n=1 Tax=Solirubrobacter soli TaxID=363832 RepID=UPI00042A71B0|nr:HAD-IC family P-type ATPase [Solirubrobacter soli]
MHSRSAEPNRALDERPWHTVPALEAARELHVDPALGLSSEAAARRLTEVRPNRLESATPEPGRVAFLRQFGEPLNVALVLAAVAALALGAPATALVVATLALVNAICLLWREGPPDEAVDALRRAAPREARVIRGGVLLTLDAQALVPGDVVALRAGDVVPADGRLLESDALQVDESALTGQVFLAPKGIDLITDADAAIGERTDMVHLGTRVVRGTARFVVTATGMASELGGVSRLLSAITPAPAVRVARLAGLPRRLFALAVGAAVLALVLGAAYGRDWTVSGETALAAALAALPVSLPIVLVAVLTHARRALAADGVVVTRPMVAETLGSITTLAIDPTGTLTTGQVSAAEIRVASHRYTVSGGAIKRVGGRLDVSLEPLLMALALVSDDDRLARGDPIGTACAGLADAGGIDVAATRAAHPRVARVPFDASYKLAATFHPAVGADGAEVVRCYALGSPSAILARTTFLLEPGEAPHRADEAARRAVLELQGEFERDGRRAIAAAWRDLRPGEFDPAASLVPLVDRLTLIGVIGLGDPPRADSADAVAAARRAGLSVHLVTGDEPGAAAAVAREAGIDGQAVSGPELDAMAEDAFADVGVLAGATARQRLRFVQGLRHRGHVVAVLADGVGDAPALAAADVGLAPVPRAAEAAQAAAAATLRGAGVATVAAAVQTGRRQLARLSQAIRFELAAGGALAGVVLAAAALDLAGGIGLTLRQVVYVTLTVHVLQAAALGRAAAAGERDRSLPLTLAGVQAAVTVACIALADAAWDAHTARTMGLATFATASVLLSVALWDERRPPLRVEALDRTLLLAVALSAVAIVAGVQTNLMHRILGTVDLDLDHWLISIGAAALVLVASEAFSRRPRTD